MNEKNGLVFIVDDDRHTRESLSNLIRSAGLSAQTFSSAQEFLAAERPNGSWLPGARCTVAWPKRS